VLSDSSEGEICRKLKNFPADSRISGNLDAETSSILTASAASLRIGFGSVARDRLCLSCRVSLAARPRLAGALLGGLAASCQVVRGVDQRHVGEGLRAAFCRRTNSSDLSTNSLSMLARTSAVNGLTVRSGPPAVASTICGPRARSTPGGAGTDFVSSIVST
jgi:hypothetical protein